MGGACLQSLVRAGCENLILADIDVFEVSNLNRQVFANLNTIGSGKVEATVKEIKNINPNLRLRSYGEEWTEKLDEILSQCKVVVNGMDDIAAGILLYRKAKEHGCTVIDAYMSPLPSVIVVKPDDPRPEERLRFPSLTTEWNSLSQEQLDECKLAEAMYVMVHSSSAEHIDLSIAGELLSGKRSRPSFSTMVITTGNLMANEAVNEVLGKKHGVDYRGAFFNLASFEVERPRSALMAKVRYAVARNFVRKLINES